MMYSNVLMCVALSVLTLNSVLSHQQRNYVDLMGSLSSALTYSSRIENYVENMEEISETAASISQEKVVIYAKQILDSLMNSDSLTLGAGRVSAVLADVSVSEQCNNDTAHFLGALVERQKWALLMFDSFGKPSSSLLQFELNWVGAYGECIGVQAPPLQLMNPETQSHLVAFTGKYCTAVLPLTDAKQGTPASPMPAPGISLGICLPSSCSTTDMVLLLNAVIEDLNITMLSHFRFSSLSSHCQDENLEYDAKAIVAIVVGSLFALLLLVGTAYDFLFVQIPKWSVLRAEEEYSAVNSGQGDDSMNIKHQIRSDEHTALLGGEKSYIDLETPQPGICGKALLAFSVYSNGLKILSTKQPQGSLRCIHGIRFLSMTWVILGHTLVFAIGTTGNFLNYFPPLLKRFSFQAIANATVSVDTFFTLSGLLVAYLTLKELKKTEGKVNWFMFYFHRFWRLTPPYMLLMLIYVPLFPYLTNGPLWPQQGVEINQCSGSWWTNLLYVNNLVKTKEMCMAWSWYLANDMQFYILSPLILLPLFYSKLIGLVVVMVFFLATTITTGVISSSYHLGPGLTSTPGGGSAANASSNATDPSSTNAYFLEYYITPYCRMGPYIIGLLAGYYLYITELRIRWNKITVVLGWSISIASALAVVYGLYDNAQGSPISEATAAFYNAVSRSVWGASVAWVIVACVAGYGGPVNAILSWKGLIPLSRLTYCAYLIHPIFMYAINYAQIKLLYFTDSLFVYNFFGNLVGAYLLAFMLSLTFESPMMGLENLFFRKKKKN